MAAQAAAKENGEFAALLDFLKRARGFDFSGYKRSTLQRRIEKRMQAVGVDGFSRYQDYLEANPREFNELFNTILINVTSFFRDPPAWEFMASETVPRLLELIPEPDTIRVWSAGCASGEEAYTIAIVLAEAMGEDAFRDRVKIYATDLDEEALQTARQAVYTDDALKAVPAGLVEKYFEQNATGLVVRPDMRRSIIFGRNDLAADAPISRIDLLVCRNVLIYFTSQAQAQILERLNFALKGTGFLFLGKSEMLVTHADLFEPHELKWRVFRKVTRGNLRERMGFAAPPALEAVDEPEQGIRSGAAALSPVAQLVVDRDGFLVDANLRARDLFALGPADVGRQFHDLAVSYRPADLRSALDRAYEERTSVRVGRIEWMSRPGEERILEIDVVPIAGAAGESMGATVIFNDVTALARLTVDYERSRRELETAYEELQSTNEELETMNEELQSTNDELETLNEEVTSRASEVDRLNVFLEGILGNLGLGVVVIDRERRVQVWNPKSTDLWGLRPEEVQGEDFLELDIGLPVETLGDQIARALGGATDPIEAHVEALSRRGRRFECLVRVMPLRMRDGETYGAMVLTAPAEDGGSLVRDVVG